MRTSQLAIVTAIVVVSMCLPAAAVGLPGPQYASIQSVRALIADGRYAEAEARARELPHALDADARVDSETTQALVEALVANGHAAGPEALALAHALVTLPSSAKGLSYRLLGDVLFQAGRYAAAVEAFGTAVRLEERVGDIDNLRVASALERRAVVAMWLDRLDLASADIDRAVRIFESHHDRRLIQALTTRVQVWHHRGDYERARADVQRAMSLQQELGFTRPDAIEVLTAYGDQLWFDGQLGQAREYLTRAIALADSTLRDGHPRVVDSLRYLGIVLDDLGELDLAREARQRAVRVTASAYGVEHHQYALQLHDLALSHIKRGDYGEARRLLHQALTIYEQRLGHANCEVGSTFHNLGVLAAELGDFRDAAALQRRAVGSWERALGVHHPVVPWALVALAEALAKQHRYASALPILERALQTRRRQLGPDHPQVATTLNALASSLVALHRIGQAAPLVDKALAIWQVSDASEGLSDALAIRARIHTARGEYVAAESDLAASADVRAAVFGTSHPSIGAGRVAWASTLLALGRRTDAFALALDGERVARDHVRLTTGYLPEMQALDYAASRTRGLDLALSVADASVAGQAFDAVIRGRSLVLDEMAARQRLRADAANANLEPLWRAFTEASRRLANLAVRGPAEDTPSTYAGLLERARRDKAAAETPLAERSATIRRQLAYGDVGIDDLRGDLPANAAIVSFVLYDHVEYGITRPGTERGSTTTPSYAAFVLRKAEPAPTFVRLGPAAPIDAGIRDWRRTATNGMLPNGEVVASSEMAVRAKGARVRARLWDPLRQALGDAMQVFLVPDGAVNLVPFAALPIDQGGYMVEANLTIHYLSAERDLVEFDTPARTVGTGLLAVGGPAYGEGEAASAHALQAEGRSVHDDERIAGRRSSCGSLDTMFFPALPASRREVEDVGKQWRALALGDDDSATVLTGTRASEAAFKRQSRRQRVLHVATHGFFLGNECEANASVRGMVAGPKAGPLSPSRPAVPLNESPLLRSGLALAGANQRQASRTDDEDGILTAEEVAALDLEGVEWAVLSACDTGLGAVRAGEGVFGLRRAFRIAGARTVIMSLWPVEDRATRSWMRALYEARLRDKLTTADAMRQASLAMLHERRAKGLSTHPLYWAGFVAAGDWR